MDCRAFESLLADFEQGNLAPGPCAEAEKHMAECTSCRLLHDLARGKVDLLPPSGQRSLTRSIMEKTSGPACGRAKELLCDFVDGALAGTDAALVSQHLEHCVECRVLASALIELERVLPSLAGIQPDPGFIELVIRTTVAQRGFQLSFRTRALEWWKRVLQRPRFSFEAAYLGTLILVLLVGNPFPAMRALSVHALDAVSKYGPAEVRGSESELLQSAKSLAVGLSDREIEFRQGLDQTRQKGEALISASVEYQAKVIGSGCRKALQSIRGFWLRLWSGRMQSDSRTRV